MRVFFTIITKSHLAQARVLAVQLAEFHPNIKFLVVLVDNPDGYFDPAKEKFEIIQLSEILDPDWWPKVTGYYTAYELCNAAKPYVHEYLLTKRNFETTVYLDSDIFVLGSLQCVLDEINGHAFLITPHLLDADLSFLQQRLEMILIWSGIFNGGFIVMRKCAEAQKFLEWWKRRLMEQCLHNYGFQEVDQSWLNFAPALFENCKISRNRGLNVGHWNLAERPLKLKDRGVFTEDQQVLFLHFSGWDYREPFRISKFDFTTFQLSDSGMAAWEQEAKNYAKLLLECGIEETAHWPYSYGRDVYGHKITPEMRRKYWSVVTSGAVCDSVFDRPERYLAVLPEAPRNGVRRAMKELILAIKNSVRVRACRLLKK